MKLTWHIIRKDLVRMRLPLALWCLLLAAHVVVGAVLVSANGFDLHWLDSVALVDHLLTALDIVVNYALVAELIQGDAMVGSQVFWMTRPISGARLLGAKFLGAVILFEFLPVAILLPWWLNCGYGPHEVGLAAVEVMFWRTLITMVAFLVSALTDGLGRFLVWSLVLAFGAVTVPLTITEMFDSVRHSFGEGRLVEPAGLGLVAYASEGTLATRQGLAFLLCVAGIAAVVANQFLTRRLVRSVSLALVGFLAAAMVFAEFPWDWSGWRLRSGERAAGLPTGVTVSFAKATLGYSKPGDPIDQQPILRIEFDVLHMPAGMAWRVERIDDAWSWSDGGTVRLEGWAGQFWPSQYNGPGIFRALGLPEFEWNKKGSDLQKYNEARIAARGATRKDPPRDTRPGDWAVVDRISNPPLALLPLDRIRSMPPAYEGTLHITMLRPELRFDWPLVAGPRRILAPNSLRIVEVEKADGKPVAGRKSKEIHATLVVTKPPSNGSSLFSFFRNFLEVNQVRGNDPDFQNFSAVNRSKNSMISARALAPRSIVVGNVDIIRERISISPPMAVLDGKLVPGPADWLDSVSLAQVAYHEDARFVRTVRVDPFTVVETK